MILHNTISRYLNSEYFPSFRFRAHTSRSLPKQLCDICGIPEPSSLNRLYATMYAGVKVSRGATIRPPPLFDQQEINKPTLQSLREFQKYIQTHFSPDELLGVYVHGSLGDYNYIPGYSDFDALIILRSYNLDDTSHLCDLQRRIRKANAYLYLFDPLQHHNLFIITEYDMQYFFEPIFPLALFEHTKEVTNYQHTLHFRCLDDLSERRRALLSWRKVFDSQWRGHMTTFSIKHAAQSILFLPLLYQQARSGVYAFKPEALELARKDFDPALWAIVDRVTELRHCWRYTSLYPYSLRRLIGMTLDYRYLHILHRYFDRRDVCIPKAILGDSFVSDGRALLNAILSKLGISDEAR